MALPGREMLRSEFAAMLSQSAGRVIASTDLLKRHWLGKKPPPIGGGGQ
jgi:hypothetical protein